MKRFLLSLVAIFLLISIYQLSTVYASPASSASVASEYGYEIIKGKTVEELQRNVNEAMNGNKHTVGGVCFAEGSYLQAISWGGN